MLRAACADDCKVNRKHPYLTCAPVAAAQELAFALERIIFRNLGTCTTPPSRNLLDATQAHYYVAVKAHYFARNRFTPPPSVAAMVFSATQSCIRFF